ncbi:MAG: hypothetical protein R3C56_37070 [Pirellulaceae bacterium]
MLNFTIRRDATIHTRQRWPRAFDFSRLGRIPDRFLNNIKKYDCAVRSAIQGKAKPVSGPSQFGSWQVSEKLGGTDKFTEYRALMLLLAKRQDASLRVYAADPYWSAEERKAELRRISNAYTALRRCRCIRRFKVRRDFFPNADEDRYILVVEDTSGQSLRLHLERPAMALTLIKGDRRWGSTKWLGPRPHSQRDPSQRLSEYDSIWQRLPDSVD